MAQGRAWLKGITGILCASILAACGSQPWWNGRSNRVTPPLWTPSPPSQRYYFADPNCQKQEPQDLALGSILLYQLTVSSQTSLPALTTPRTDISSLNVRSTPTLNSPHITDVNTGTVLERTCSNAYTGQGRCNKNGRTIDWTILSAGAPLKICQANSEYGRDSFEATALTSMVQIEKTMARFERTSIVTLGDVSLDIFPTYRSIFENERNRQNEKVRMATYLTRNLAYFPLSRRIAVFPESEADEKLYDKVGHLWESQFGLAHETAHHLEQGIAEQVGDPWRALWDPLSHNFQARQQFATTATTAHGNVLRSGLSEGFADLAAFYASDGDQNSILALYNIGENRNPVTGTFYLKNQQLPKQLTSPVLQGIVGEPCTRDCAPVLTTHDLGAIMAYGMHTALVKTWQASQASNQTFPYDDSLWATQMWLKSTLSFMKRYENNASAGKNIWDAFMAGSEGALSEVAKRWGIVDQSSWESQICRHYAQTFSALQNFPFSQNSQCP